MELAVGIATVLLASAIAFSVHLYRPKIGYELRCASDKFYVTDGRINHQGEGLSETIEVGSLVLKNPSFNDIENFEIVFEGSFQQANLRTGSTSTISKDIVRFDNSDSGIRIKIKTFSKSEEISINYSIIGSFGLDYRKPKKSDGKFELYSLRERVIARNFFISGLLIPIYFLLCGVLGALLFGFLDLA